MGCSLTKPDPGAGSQSHAEQVACGSKTTAASPSPPKNPPDKTSFPSVQLFSLNRSRRASSLAPAPSTPFLGTPLRDTLHGSETTGRLFSWRATVDLLQSRARRSSSSTLTDRRGDTFISTQASQDLGGIPISRRAHRMASTDSSALDFADVSLDSLALTRYKKPFAAVASQASDYVPAVHSSPASDSSALHASSVCNSETPHSAAVCPHCGSLLQSSPAQAKGVTFLEPELAELDILDRRRSSLGSVMLGQINQRRPRRASSTLAGRLHSRAASADGMPHLASGQTHGLRPRSSADGTLHMARAMTHPLGSPGTSTEGKSRMTSALTRRFGSPGSSGSNSPRPSVSHSTAAADAEAVSRQLSTFCGSQVMAGPEFNFSKSLYLPPPRPNNETSRRNALEALQVMQDPPAAAFRDIAVCAAAAFDVSGCVVSLVGDTQSWSQGNDSTFGFFPRQLCLATWTLLPNQPEVMVVPNALQDFRIQNHPLVAQEPGLRFFASAAMVTSGGHRIGSLSLTDSQPRDLNAAGQKLLANFAGMAVRQLEHGAALRKQVEHAYQAGHAVALSNAIHSFLEPMMVLDISQPQLWRILAVNQAWTAASGICREHAEGSLLWDVLYMPNMAVKTAAQMCSESAGRQSDFSLQLASQVDQEDRLTIKSMNFQFRPASSALMTAASSGIKLPASLPTSSEEISEQFYLAIIRTPNLVPAGPLGPGGLGLGLGLQSMGSGCMQRRGSNCWQEEQNQDLPAAIADAEPFSAVNLGPLLGSGGSGHVYRGTWNGATVAVKVVEAEHAADDTSKVPLKPLEAMLSVDLSHPNIIHTYKYYSRIRQDGGDRYFVGTDKRVPKVSETWLVLEYCSKGSLQDALDRGWFRSRKAIMDGSADLAFIMTTAQEIASAMAYLHDLDILHGDLSSNNVLLASASDDQRGFTAKVADFGMARMVGQEDIIQTKAIGTITHMPPELMLDGAMSHAVDVYAFGVVLWELYTAQRAWAGMRQAQIVHTVCTLEQQLEFPYGTPQPYEDLSMSCMSQDPLQRPTFAQIVTQLEELSDLAATDPLEMMSEGYPMHIL